MPHSKKITLIALKEMLIFPWVLLSCAGWATLYFIRSIHLRFLERRYAKAGAELDTIKAEHDSLQAELERLTIRSASK